MTEDLVLTKFGQWLSNGEPITHAGTVALFFRILRRDEDGYFLEIGREHKRVEVEDTPQFVVRILGDLDRSPELEFSDGAVEALDPARLRYSHSLQRLIIHRAKDGIVARFLHAPYHEILQRAEPQGDGYALRVGERLHALALEA
jgi:hypothetical protein